MKIKILTFFGILLLIFIVFRNWFSLNPLSAGDWGYKFSETIGKYPIFPYAWDSTGFSTGLGKIVIFLIGLNSYFLSTTSLLFNNLNIPWVLIERLIWFWPFLFISLIAPYLLFSKIFSKKFAFISSLVFLFNSYILMIVGGGQMGIAMAYSLAPLILLAEITLLRNLDTNKISRLTDREQLNRSILLGFLFCFQLILDIRIAYITIAMILIYLGLWIFTFSLNNGSKIGKIKFLIKIIFYSLFLPGLISLLLNLFWILPGIISGSNPINDLGSAYSSIEAVKFFSFVKLENSLSLMHPYWSDNIFGKTRFLDPIFIIIPILAFSSLIYIKNLSKEKKFFIIFFNLLGLIGIFLAKGSSDPLGEIYLWLFNYFPGFFMFRDSSKWYLFIVISYSILIPFTISKIYESIEKFDNVKKFTKNKILNLQNIFLILIGIYFLTLLKPALLGQLNGTFKSAQVPFEYIQLKNLLEKDKNFSRVLWVPQASRYGYYSGDHPAVLAQDYLKIYDSEKIIKELKQNKSKDVFSRAGVKYIIVPYDNLGEIFLEDRKYSDKNYSHYVNSLNSIGWIKRVGNFGKIVIYEAQDPKDHFWCDCNAQINFKYINSTLYTVNLKNVNKGDKLIFNEAYDKKWIMKNSNLNINSEKYDKKYNSFVLPEGSYSAQIYYSAQDWLRIGLIISLITFFSLMIIIFYLYKKY